MGDASGSSLTDAPGRVCPPRYLVHGQDFGRLNNQIMQQDRAILLAQLLNRTLVIDARLQAVFDYGQLCAVPATDAAFLRTVHEMREPIPEFCYGHVSEASMPLVVQQRVHRVDTAE